MLPVTKTMHCWKLSASQLKNEAVRKNQGILPRECKMQTLMLFNNHIHWYRHIWLRLQNNSTHTQSAVGHAEYELYATEWRPQGDLHQTQTAETWLSNGDNPTLVTHYLNAHNAKVKPHDVYNICQQLPATLPKAVSLTWAQARQLRRLLRRLLRQSFWAVLVAKDSSVFDLYWEQVIFKFWL